MKFCAGAVLFALSFAGGAFAQGKNTVSGVLIQDMSKQPIKRARVSLASVENPQRWASCITGDQGHFTFTDVPPGKYTLAAEVRGFKQLYRQDGGFSTAIVTGAGVDTEHVIFAMPGPARLTVSVFDEEGDPVRDARISLYRNEVVDGWPQIVAFTQAGARAGGEHSFANLPAGVYLVGVEARPWYAQNAPQPAPAADGQQQPLWSELDVAYPITYYGDVSDPDAATPLRLAEGQRAEIRINMRAVPSAHLELKSLDASGANSGPGDQNANAQIFARGPGGALLPIQAQWDMMGNQERVISGIAPGRYLVSVTRFNGRFANSLGAVDMTIEGTTDIDMRSATKTSVKGTVSCNGAPAGQRMAVLLTDTRSQTRAFGFVQHDGKFEVSAGGPARGTIPPGDYLVDLANAPEAYIKSVTARGASYRAGILHVREGDAVELNIVGSLGRQSVPGTAMKDGAPVPGAMILMIPDDFTHGAYMPRDQSDGDGTFTLPYVPPGHYRLIAVDNGKGLAYHHLATLQPYLSRALSVDVPLKPGTHVQVQVQAREP